MQVKKRLQINIAFSIITAFIIALMLTLALSGVNRAREQSELVGDILSSSLERNSFRNDYLRTGNERARLQWVAKSEQISRLLKSALDKFNNSEDTKNINELIANNESTMQLFSEIVKNRVSAKSGLVSSELAQEIEKRLVTQLNVKLYDKVLQTRRLRESAGAHLLSALRRAGWSIFFVIAVVAAAAAINSWTIGRTIINRIRLLRDGASIIGQGNLDHRIKIRGDDEFAELSKAFNAMTANLRDSYLSLENEIDVRRRSEEALRESQQRYTSLFNNSTIGISHCRTIVDEHGKPIDYEIIQINNAYEQITGIKKGDIEGKTAREVFPGIEHFFFDYIGNYGKIALEGGELNFEIFFETTAQWLSIYVYRPMPGEFTAIFTDITDRKRAEEELRRTLKVAEERTAELQSANKELEAFSYSLSHDLRTPLRSISAFSEVLVEAYADKLDEKGRDYIMQIKIDSERLAKLVYDVLKLSVITRSELKVETIDLSALVKEAAGKLMEADQRRVVEFIIQPGVYASGDPGLVRVLLENLLDNAWKFTGRQKRAIIEFGMFEKSVRRDELGVRSKDSSVSEPVTPNSEHVYFVKDNGVGFDKAYAESIFTPFQRLHDIEEFPGIGIGLASVQRIVRRHGGLIWVEAEEGKGASFFFTLRE